MELVQLFIQRVINLVHVHGHGVDAQFGGFSGNRSYAMVGGQRHPDVVESDGLVQPGVEVVQIAVQAQDHLFLRV